MENSLPQWDMKAIYSSVDGDDFKAALSSVDSLCLSLKEKIGSREPLGVLVEDLNRLKSTYETLRAYTECLLSADTSSQAFIRAAGEVEERSVSITEVEALFQFALCDREEEIEDPGLSRYHYVLSWMKEDAEHRMSLEEEVLARDLMRCGSSSFERLFDSVTSSISDNDRTLEELRSDAYSPDRAVRLSSYEREKRILNASRDVLASSLNSVKGTCLVLEKRQGWKSPLEHSLFLSRLSESSLNALISAIEKNLPFFHHYFRIKARLLGLESLSWADLFAPVDDGRGHRSYSWAEAKDLVVSAFSSFSPDMGNFARKAFDENWIDAAVRKNKVGGAYDVALPDASASRVLTNFTGDYTSVSTLAHELGHAYHDSLVMKLPFILSSYPMTLAETASIFSEQLLFNHVGGCDDIVALESFLCDASQTCVDILSRFYFESSLFEKRRAGEVGAEELCDLMRDAQMRSYGDAVTDKHELMWAVKSHYYSVDFSFYNYPYAFGLLFALSLYSMARNDRTFNRKYDDLLTLAGSASCETVASLVGCDITREAFWQSGLDLIASYVGRFDDALRKM